MSLGKHAHRDLKGDIFTFKLLLIKVYSITSQKSDKICNLLYFTSILLLPEKKSLKPEL